MGAYVTGIVRKIECAKAIECDTHIPLDYLQGEGMTYTYHKLASRVCIYNFDASSLCHI